MTRVAIIGGGLAGLMTAHLLEASGRPGGKMQTRRFSMLFRTPFWRRLITGSRVMLDAFGGWCLYDEAACHGGGEHGVLGWLLAGAEALLPCNADDRTLAERPIDSLPRKLHRMAHEQFIEAKRASVGRGRTALA